MGFGLHSSQAGKEGTSYWGKAITTIIIIAQDPTYLVIYMFWMKIILVELGPYISISGLNTALIIL